MSAVPGGEPPVEIRVEERIGYLTFNRPKQLNAFNHALMEAVTAGLRQLIDDPAVLAIVVSGAGRAFSAGFDLKEADQGPPRESLADWSRVLQYDYDFIVQFWDCPKPTIAAVQGRAIAGALNLVWPMDLIVAADDMLLEDPVALMAIGGVEYHGHTWELGARRAKDMLFTGRGVDAQEALQLGLVREVVPRDQLWDAANDLALLIAQRNPFGLAQAKRAVNQTLDVQGFYAALQSAFDIHHTGHGNAQSVSGYPILANLEGMKGELQ